MTMHSQLRSGSLALAILVTVTVGSLTLLLRRKILQTPALDLPPTA